MSNDVTYRSATLDDVPNILALWERAAEPRSTDSARALAIAIEHDADLVIVAVSDGGIIASLVSGWDGWRGNMYRLAVDADHRRQGIAEELVRRAEEVLRQRGVERITSLVIVDAPGAARFWETAGYEADGSVQRYAKNLGQH